MNGTPRMALNLLLCFMLGPCFAAAGPAFDPQSASQARSTIVLQIGRYDVSRLALDLSFKRFSSSASSRGLPPDTRAVQEWFKSYLERQVLIAKAISDGYDRRPEVTAAVEGMSEYMLTQADGALYKSLSAERPITAESLRELYDTHGRLIHVAAARVPDETATFLAAPEWRNASTEHKLQQLRELADRDSLVLLRDGEFGWPYEPFLELEAQLRSPKPDTWIERKTFGCTTVAYIYSVHTAPQAPFEQAEKSFRPYVEHQQRRLIRKEREDHFLSQVSFVPHRPVIDQLSSILRQLPSASAEVSRGMIESISNESLASYKDSQAIEVTVDQWRTFYNHQLLRSLPRTPGEIDQSIRDLVTSRFDLRDARRLGLDQTDQFTESRLAFLHNQAVDLFEREKLLPAITVSDAEVQQRYEAEHARNERAVPSFERAATQVRTMVAHERLAHRESELVPQWARSFTVTDKIPYFDFGLIVPPQRPWAQAPVPTPAAQ